MKLELGREIINLYDEACSREWLETNGLGGYASGTISGVNTRRYHGLLVAALKPPLERKVLLSKLDETIFTESGEKFELSCNQFPGKVSPAGFLFMNRYVQDPFPVFEFELGKIKINKSVIAIHGENTTLVTYEVLDADAPFTLNLKPLVAYRDYHYCIRANDRMNWGASFGNDTLLLEPYPELPQLKINVPKSTFHFLPSWNMNFEHLVENYRGLDYLEDLFTHGYFSVKLKKGDKICITVTIEPEIGNGWAKIESETKRREKLNTTTVFRDDFTDVLAQAADKFVVRRGENLKTIIAGYHWFSDWGRDTMISLPGLCLVTGRHEDAKKILKAFAVSLNKGLIPNRFPDYGEEPEYNTVDATLWFFNAIYEYYKYTGDLEFIKNDLLDVLSDSINWHLRGTFHNIHMDVDGLLSSGEHGQQLTWMDAKCDDWVVTPREGKVVEINALWYNALRIMEHFSLLTTDKENQTKYKTLADKVKEVFIPTFEVPYEKYLFDYVDGDYKDFSIRPNMVFALSLPFPIVEKGELAENIIKIIEEKLLTPIGLRSLDPDHLCYVGIYKGNQRERDGSYHQGTVWSWLLGHYFTAKIRIQGESGRKEVEKFLEAFQYHILEAGIGNVSEIFDGNAPFAPKGCIAQAWGVAEILRAYVEDVKGVRK